jgi:hypothetical protein
MAKWLAVALASAAVSGLIGWGCSSDSEQSGNPLGTGATSGTGASGATGGAGGGGALGGFTSAGGGGAAGSGGMASCAEASASVLASPIDIIISIDQSPSMAQETQGVIDNLNTHLVQILEAVHLDYQVIFVTGATGLPTGTVYFQSNVNINSSDMLTQLLWSYDGSTRAPNTCNKSAPNPALAWKSWLRQQSFKVFLAFTDDDPTSFNCAGAGAYCNQQGWNCSGCDNNCASGSCPMWQCPTYAEATADWGGDSFPAELYKLTPEGMFGIAARPRWIMHSIVPVQQALTADQPLTGLHQVCNQNGNTGETTGVEYQKLSKLTGGLRFPSCNTDYSPVFETIADTITPLACKFTLEQTNLGTPDPNKTNVLVDYGDGNGPQLIPQDTSQACDAGANGWQWTDNGEVVVLCGPACDNLTASANASVNITVGCNTFVR